MSRKLSADADQLLAELQHLATLSDCAEPPPAVTRVVFSEADLRARAYLKGLYEEAGLAVRVDPIGNTFARWEGAEPAAGVVGSGSHTDAIPHSGMYDGTVGVLGALEAIRTLKRSGYCPRRSIELVMFTSEEPTRFGVGCTGSRAMTGRLTADQLTGLKDESGDNYDEVRQRAGFSGALQDVLLPEGYYHAFIELHIEQGPELEAAGLPIGVVTAIAAPSQLTLCVEGEGGHAGAVLMPVRRDALTAAAEVALAVERLARESVSPDLVATVGQLGVHPGAANSIPSRVTMSLDLRDIDLANRDAVLVRLREVAEAIACRRGVKLQVTVQNADPPSVADAGIVDAAEQACRDLGASHQRMISRAYHDSLFIGQVAPMGMLFIPCRGGVSHRPDEYASPEAMATGVEVLAATLAKLAEEA
ncbi:N-carbamoyl-L-amino acid hydrolase [Pirellulimonas nuda]|uniref:N-carbamoyl-L-amino acid hydrolase n=1 Tax=Pirellulimonas nuda TaxID=2528009 RepID=A0A518DGZ9_9BACT|nr:M20 family metallo-hydrolase [Pirellulimonas nuda]QDU90746.1 N-carbamoyl-L-amino acid hydrolase [Pirellulimonas nuda]